MDALDYAYEWLELSAQERKQKNLDIDSGLLEAFVAGYEAAQKSVQADGADEVCKICSSPVVGKDGYCQVCR